MSISHSFIELGSVDSTNNYAMAKVHAGMAFQGTIFFAHEQWAGKGQRGKSWNSQPGENIIMSAVLEPVFLPVTRQFPLSACVALACHDFYSRYAGAGEIFIKWPNDLYWRDRKAGGILIENSFRGDKWLAAIAGIGLNINQVVFPETVRNPVSLRQITGRTHDAVKMARELGDCLWSRYEQLQSEEGAGSQAGELGGSQTKAEGGSGKDTDPTKRLIVQKSAGSLIEEYNIRLFQRGKLVRLKKDHDIFETLLEGVSSRGELLTWDTIERRFDFGEVEWVI